jgi:hypothetical protein
MLQDFQLPDVNFMSMWISSSLQRQARSQNSFQHQSTVLNNQNTTNGVIT